MTGEFISRAQLLLQYYAALNELANETEPSRSAETYSYTPATGFGDAGAQLVMVS